MQKYRYRYGAIGTEDALTAIQGQMGSATINDMKVPAGARRISHVAISFAADMPSAGVVAAMVRLQGDGLTGENKPYDFVAGAQGGQADSSPITTGVTEYDTELPVVPGGTIEIYGVMNGSADVGQIAIGVELTFDEGAGIPTEAWIVRHTSSLTDDGVEVEATGLIAATGSNRPIIPQKCTQITTVALTYASDDAVIGDALMSARLSGQAMKGEFHEFAGPGSGGDLVAASSSIGGIVRVRKVHILVEGGQEFIPTLAFDPTDTGTVAGAIGICCR